MWKQGQRVIIVPLDTRLWFWSSHKSIHGRDRDRCTSLPPKTSPSMRDTLLQQGAGHIASWTYPSCVHVKMCTSLQVRNYSFAYPCILTAETIPVLTWPVLCPFKVMKFRSMAKYDNIPQLKRHLEFTSPIKYFLSTIFVAMFPSAFNSHHSWAPTHRSRQSPSCPARPWQYIRHQQQLYPHGQG